MSHVLIKGFDPLKLEKLEILDPSGKVINPELEPKINKETLLKMYETMSLGRIADNRAVQYQRQGRMLTYAPNIGQEATQVGATAALIEGDWLSPAFRELNMMLYKGIPLDQIYLYWYGNEMGSQHDPAKRVLPVNIIIGSQIAIAAGLAMGSQKQGENNIAVATIGDGGTSHADFNEGLNFAGSFKAPLVVIIQNNKYGISTPTSVQTQAATLAQKGVAAGIKTIQVDGNDALAMYVATKAAADHARSGKGTVLIEAMTYRMGAHTTSDDPTIYRSSKEVEEWAKKDPIDRLKKYLISKKWWSEAKDKALQEKNDKYVQEVFAKVEKTGGEVPLEDIFKYVYAEMTPAQVEQYEYYQKFLEGSK